MIRLNNVTIVVSVWANVTGICICDSSSTFSFGQSCINVSASACGIITVDAVTEANNCAM